MAKEDVHEQKERKLREKKQWKNNKEVPHWHIYWQRPTMRISAQIVN